MNDPKPRHATGATTVSTGSFRALMAGFPSGVAIVTTIDEARCPFGLTVSSLCAVSLEPPLLLVCIASSSPTLAVMKRSGVFAVNLLHFDGHRAARVFASGASDRFDTIPWSPTGLGGLPALSDDAHSVADCDIRETVVAGDHTIVIGRVLAIESLASSTPLMYGQRRYAPWPAEHHLADQQ